MAGRSRTEGTFPNALSYFAGLLMGVFVVSPAHGTDVMPGSDMFETPPVNGPGPGASHLDLTIPADFFAPGSAPFSGRVYWEGAPLTGTGLNGADTIVERLDIATLTVGGPSDTIPIEIVALSLVSTAPITISFGGAGSSTYDIRGCLSSTSVQPGGSMTIRHECPEGGTFDSTLPVVARLIFTKVAGAPGPASSVMDPAPTITLATTQGHWSHNDGGVFGILQNLGGGTVDHDCNAATAVVPFAGTSNFFVGIRWDPCTVGGGGVAKKRLTKEQELLASHGVVPTEIEQSDQDLDGIHNVADNCINTPNPVQEDCDDNGVGDACDAPCLPTLPRWAGFALGALLFSAGYFVFRNRRKERAM